MTVHRIAFAVLALAAQPFAALTTLPATSQSSLLPEGPQAAHIHDLWNLTLIICTLVFAAVLVALCVALWRAPRGDAVTAPTVQDSPGAERQARWSVGSAVTASVALLLFLITASVLTDRALASLTYRNALHIEVTANQWWWEVRYDDAVASNVFTTANELHIPVGRPVVLTLRSADVIHSFWVPNLAGKKDLIPGRTATLHLMADRPGTYRGQCAEFCGYQHSFMAFLVIAESPQQYDTWATNQRTPAAVPVDAVALRGRELFLSTTCVMCHSVEGTLAAARKGPDLSHVATRATLAAGALPNTANDMAHWIRNPQQFKPGANMPASNLSDDDLRAIVAYLRTLS